MHSNKDDAANITLSPVAGTYIYKVLVIDLIGMILDKNGQTDYSEVKAYILSIGGEFHLGNIDANIEKGALFSPDKIHFFYQPNLSREEEILAQTDAGQYDAVIAAATFIPASSVFPLGGVRIGAGTANMKADIWGGGNGIKGTAPLMNTPSYNSRATAQAAFKALLKVLPDLKTQAMHNLVVSGDFDTGKHLVNFPTTKLEGKRLAIIGYGNIGREMAKLGAAFGMQVVVFARGKHQKWIESEGFEYAKSIIDAAKNADIISPHTGLGAFNNQTKRFANAGIINDDVFSAMNQNSVLINYDRGEVVDIKALDKNLATGKIQYAAIDADIFKDPITSELSGPMVPYRNIYIKHQDKMQLLPHAAADTEHVSRVDGAKQAVNQIVEVIRYKRVINLIGDLPEGYTNGGARTVNGVGKVTLQDFLNLDSHQISTLTTLAHEQAAFWQSLNKLKNKNISSPSTDMRNESPSLQDNDNEHFNTEAEDFVLKSNQYHTLLQALGLKGPFQ